MKMKVALWLSIYTRLMQLLFFLFFPNILLLNSITLFLSSSFHRYHQNGPLSLFKVENAQHLFHGLVSFISVIANTYILINQSQSKVENGTPSTLALVNFEIKTWTQFIYNSWDTWHWLNLIVRFFIYSIYS